MPRSLTAAPGTTYGSWFVLRVPTTEDMKSQRYHSAPSVYRWCRCTCGTEQLVATQSLKAGTSRSCRKCAGLRRAAALREANVEFGEGNHLPSAPPVGWPPDVARAARTLIADLEKLRDDAARELDSIKLRSYKVAQQTNMLRAKAHQLKTLRDKLKQFARENNIEWPSAD